MLSLAEKVRLFTDYIKAGYKALNIPFPTDPDPFEPVTSEDLEDVERQLAIILPNDLRRIAPIFCGDHFILTPQLSLKRFHNDENIIDKTIRLREGRNLPRRYIFLSEFDESFVLMETQSHADLPTPVHWSGSWAISDIAADGPVERYRTFSSYEEYFTHCLDDEIAQLI